MTHGQSVSSCFYRGKSKTHHKSTLTLKLKRGLTCKEKHPIIIKKTTYKVFSTFISIVQSYRSTIAQTSVYAFNRYADILKQK